MKSTSVLRDKCAPEEPIYEIVAENLGVLGLETGDHVEAIDPSFYNFGDIVLAMQNGFAVIGELTHRFITGEFLLHVPACDGWPEENYRINRGDAVGVVCKFEMEALYA